MREPNTTSSTDSIRSTETLLVDKELALKDAANQESAGLLVDGGKEAWLFMVGSFMVDAVLWGLPLNFGIFQNYYESHAPFVGNQYIPMVGTFAMGISYLGGFIMVPLTMRYHYYRRQLICVGIALCMLGALGASFATELWELILYQGVLYGLGLLVVSYVIFSQLNEWFIERRGLAYGIQLSASGLGGLFLPFVLETLLERYGYARTLRIYIIVIIAFVGPPILLLRSRPRRTTTTTPCRFRINYSVLKEPSFYFLASANLLQGLAFYVPIFYLPSIATSLSILPSHTALLLALLNFSHVLGLLSFGYLSDLISPYTLLTLSTATSSLSVLALLGPATTYSSLALFACTYGFFGGGFESLFPRFVTALTRDPEVELLLYSVFEVGSGVGIMVAGPISVWLIGADVDAAAYGCGKYGGVIIFVGACLGIASLGGLGWFWKKRSRGEYVAIDGDAIEDCEKVTVSVRK